MNTRRFLALFLALALLFSSAAVVRAVPPLPPTLYGKVQVGGADAPDGTQVSAWMGSAQAIAEGAPLSFPHTGVTLTFSRGCGGQVSVQRRVGQTQVVSQGSYTSVYALDAQGPVDWMPPDAPASDGQPITLKISDTVATSTPWSMGSVVPLPLSIDALTGMPPFSPAHAVLLEEEWELRATCTGYVATVTIGYDEGMLAGAGEANLVGLARYNPSNNRWEYLVGTVDPQANTVTLSNVTAFSRWRLLAFAPPGPVPDMSPSAVGDDLALSWSTVAQDIRGGVVTGLTYQVYRAADRPFFSPGAAPYATTGDTGHTDPGALADPETDYYYLVTAMDGAGRESALSDRAGMVHTTLAPGWQLVSWPLEPSGPAVEEVLRPIEGRYCRVLGETGVYDCALEPVYRTLNELHAGQAYYLRVDGTGDAYLRVLGRVLPVGQAIPLHQYWNWVGYLPYATLPIAEALQSIEGKYLLVHSLDKTYDPANPVYSTLWEMEPGQGYLIRASEAVTLTYPLDRAPAPAARAQTSPTACGAVSPAPAFTVVYGRVTADGAPAASGTQVEIVTPRGEVAGCFVVRQAGEYGYLHVYGAGGGDPPIPGFQEGESLAFRVNGVEVSPSQVVTWTNDLTPHKVDVGVAAVERHPVYLPVIMRSG